MFKVFFHSRNQSCSGNWTWWATTMSFCSLNEAGLVELGGKFFYGRVDSFFSSLSPPSIAWKPSSSSLSCAYGFLTICYCTCFSSTAGFCSSTWTSATASGSLLSCLFFPFLFFFLFFFLLSSLTGSTGGGTSSFYFSRTISSCSLPSSSDLFYWEFSCLSSGTIACTISSCYSICFSSSLVSFWLSLLILRKAAMTSCCFSSVFGCSSVYSCSCSASICWSCSSVGSSSSLFSSIISSEFSSILSWAGSSMTFSAYFSSVCLVLFSGC